MTNDAKSPFANRNLTKAELDSGTVFNPRFNSDGLITVVTVDADDNTVLMVAYMNALALQRSLETGIATYWSRSRGTLWKKGETSGNVQIISEIRTDCDQDVILLRVRTQDSGASCHTGRKSCFYRTLEHQGDGQVLLRFDESDKPRFDPDKVYE